MRAVSCGVDSHVVLSTNKRLQEPLRVLRAYVCGLKESDVHDVA